MYDLFIRNLDPSSQDGGSLGVTEGFGGESFLDHHLVCAPVPATKKSKLLASCTSTSPDGGWCLSKKKSGPGHVRVLSFPKNLPGVLSWKSAGRIVRSVICHIGHCGHVPAGRKDDSLMLSSKRNDESQAICTNRAKIFSLLIKVRAEC